MRSEPKGLAHPFKLIYRELADQSRYVTRTVYDHFLLKKWSDDLVNICLRHDVDIALNLVIPLAEYERELGLFSSYYFLTDTAPYDIWNSEIPRRLTEMGHEVGLHSDHYYEQVALGRDGLVRLKEDAERLGELARVENVGVAWHGGKHMLPFKCMNYELYENIPASELGLLYHDAVFYYPDTRKWSSNTIISDGENNMRFNPHIGQKRLRAEKVGGDVLIVGHPYYIYTHQMRPKPVYPNYPHLSPPNSRTLLMDLKSFVAYNKNHISPRTVWFVRRIIKLIEWLSVKFMNNTN